MKSCKRPLNRSITIGCTVFIIMLCILLSIANLTLYKNYVYQDYREYIAEILNFTMSYIDGDDLRLCIETGEESEKYKETLLFMDNLMTHYDDIHYFYAVLPLNTENTGNVMSVFSAERYYDRYVDTEGNLYLGWISDDEYDSETAALLFDVLYGDKICYFIEDTEWGIDYTGAMPIRDSAGEPVAVLAVDIDFSFLHDMILRYAEVNVCVISLVGLLFIFLFLFWSRKNITEPIKELEQSAVGFADHSHGLRDVEALNFVAPEVKSDNEIKSLSEAVSKMAEDMRSYVIDVVSAEKKAANLKQLANHDALTGIRNKTAYDREIQRVSAMLENGDAKVGLAIADLNDLKKINDSCGHDKGDIAIKTLCRIICSVFKHSAVFRIGGDEFVIILRGEDYDDYAQLEARFHEELEKLQKDDALQPWEKVSAALGAAFYDEALDKGMDSLFQRADQVMYEHKKAMKAAC